MADTARPIASTDLAYAAGVIKACAGRSFSPITPRNVSGGTFQRVYQLAAAPEYVRFVFRNFYVSSTPAELAVSRIAVKASVIWGITAGGGGAFVPITFNGRRDAIIEPYQTIISDPVRVDPTVAAGDYFGVRSFVLGDGIVVPVETSGVGGIGPNSVPEGYKAGDFTDAASNFFGSDVTFSFGPTEVLGTPIRGSMASLYAAGDSVLQGIGWRTSPAAPYAPGFVGYFGTINNVALLNTGSAGETVAGALTGSLRRLASVSNYKHALCEYGINDIATADTLATIKANLIAYWTMQRRAGATTVRQTTFPPRTTSTDKWRTVANQTVMATEAKRLALNQWLRAPASAGAGNSALADASAVLTGIIDSGALCEANADGSAVAINPTTGAISNGAGGFWQADATVYASGTLTSGTAAAAMNDSGKAWTANQWYGYAAFATSGAAAGQSRQVATNNATGLTFYDNFSPAPAAGDTYELRKVATLDGVHPGSLRYIIMAGALSPSMFL